MQPLQRWAESAPLGGNRVKVSENLGATLVAPVACVVTSLSAKTSQEGTECFKAKAGNGREI